MTEEKISEIRDLLTIQGVYGKVKDITIEEYYSVFENRKGIGSLDLFCPCCKANKTFVFRKAESSNLLGSGLCTMNSFSTWANKIYVLTYECPTCGNLLYYSFYYTNNTIIKLAQYPSLFDVSRDELKKYRNNGLIDAESFDQIYKAEICASESYFVAAYTYMRRVYESMLISVFRQNENEIGITEEEYRKKRSDEKMEIIKPYLAIDEEVYKPLYALLSAGIHSLTEEECCEDYTLLKSILLDILVEQKAKTERAKKRKDIQDLYSKRKSELKNNN